MKRMFYMAMALMAVFAMNSCKDKKTHSMIMVNDSIPETEESDSTIYGVCGDGTSMHSLELLADSGDSLSVLIDEDEPDIVQGGLLSGDRIALIGYKDANGEYVAQHVINLTSLLGKWTSIDKSFEILEGGEVKNQMKAEEHPWTSWKILNGKLLLNTDTFAVNKLGPDSLALENKVGIFVFKRLE